MKKDHIISRSCTAILYLFVCTVAFGQKLPNIQENSVFAPQGVKVDAKLNEWGDTFQAQNKTTNIFYTVANDNTNLYLVLKSANQMNNNKIIAGGLSLTLNTSGKKKEKDKENFVIDFPVINYENLRSQMMSFRSGSNGPPDSAAIESMRKKAVGAFKEVKLFGFKDISDSVISVYNEYGIKAFVDFDNKGNLIIEMGLPLKYLNLSPGSSKEIAYNIKLNGLNLNAIMPGAAAMMGNFQGGGGSNFSGGGGFGGGGDNVRVTTGGGMSGMPRGMDDVMGMLSPTDFWGKYVLAKK